MRCRRFGTDRIKNREARTSYWISPPLIPSDLISSLRRCNRALTASSAKPRAKNINNVLTASWRSAVSAFTTCIHLLGIRDSRPGAIRHCLIRM
jgi:hypothetical protein